MVVVRSISFLLFFLLPLAIFGVGCTTPPQTVRAPASLPPQVPPRLWVGERAKVVVLEFGNKVSFGSSGKRTIPDSVFGDGMKKHLVVGMQQTEQFAILNQLSTKRVLTEQDFTLTGEIKQKALGKISFLEEAEFLIAGTVTVYQPSLESLNAGIGADPFFGEAQSSGQGVSAGILTKAFESLPVASNDRIAISVRLIDAANGKTVKATTVEGVPQEFGQQRGGLFGEKLTGLSGSLQTPMQKALRVCTIKAVDWIAETSLAHRRQPVSDSSSSPSAIEKSGPIKKAVIKKKTERGKLPPEPEVRKRAPSEKPFAEEPTVEKPIAVKPGATKPMREKPVMARPVAEKPLPKQEAPHSEEWGQ